MSVLRVSSDALSFLQMIILLKFLSCVFDIQNECLVASDKFLIYIMKFR